MAEPGRGRELLALFAIGLVVRATTALVVLPSNILSYAGGDGAGYHALAVSVSHGHLLDPQYFEARPPGLPWLAGLIYWVTRTRSPLVLVIISISTASLIAPLGAMIAAELEFSRQRQLTVGLLLTVEPTLVWLGIAPLADAPFAATVTVAVLAALRLFRTRQLSRGLVLGGCLALAVFIKPASLLLWVLPVSVLLVRRQVHLAAVVGIVAVLPIIGWTVRNISDTGIPTYSTIGNWNLLTYRAAGIQHRVEGVSADEVLRTYERELAQQLHLKKVEPYTYYADPPNDRTYDAVQSKALAVITHHPVQYLDAIPVGVWRLGTTFEMVHGRGLKAFTVYYVGLYALAGLGWIRCLRSRPALAWSALGIIVYFCLILVVEITAGFGGTRQAAPFLAVVYLLALWPRAATRPPHEAARAADAASA